MLTAALVIGWRRRGRGIILFAASVMIGVFAAQALAGRPERAAVSGRIVDRETGEPLAGANVYIAHSTIGSSTNREGLYLITRIPVIDCNINACDRIVLNVSTEECIVQEGIIIVIENRLFDIHDPIGVGYGKHHLHVVCTFFIARIHINVIISCIFNINCSDTLFITDTLGVIEFFTTFVFKEHIQINCFSIEVNGHRKIVTLVEKHLVPIVIVLGT